MMQSIPFIDQLANATRWWASMGAFLALPPATRFWLGYVARTLNERQAQAAQRYLPRAVWKQIEARRTGHCGNGAHPWTRIILGGAAIVLMGATLLMGAIIPWAHDGRVSWFTRDSALYTHALTVGWLLWGLGCWATAVAFSRQYLPMVVSAVVWWWAMLFAASATRGIYL